MAILLLCFLAAALLPQQVGAQARGDSAWVAPVVVITATRDRDNALEVPAAATTVDATQIRRGEPGVSLDEALRHVPGIVASNRHNLSQGERLTVRGLGARAAFGVRGLKVLLDGIPLTTPDGQTQLGNIDLGAADRIEVLRGPVSSLYGNAGGGVVSVHSRTPQSGPWRVEPGIVVGSDGLRRSHVRAHGGSDRHRVELTMRHLRWDGYRDHSAALVRGAGLVGRHDLGGPWQLTTVLNLYDAPWMLNPSSLARADAEATPRMARGFVVSQGASKVARQLQGGVALRHEQEAARTEVVLFGVSRDLTNPIPGAYIELDRLSGGLRATHGRDVAVAGWPARWLAGFDAEFQRDDRGEYGNEGIADGDLDPGDVPDAVVRGDVELRQQERVRSLSPFLSLDVHPLPGLHLTAGARFDRYRFAADDELLTDGDQSGTRSLSHVSPSLAASWRATDLTWAYASIGTAFQTPTTTELSNRPDGGGGFHPDLGPETILSAEVGVRGHWPRWRLSWDMAAYRMTIDDMLIPFQADDPGSDAAYYRNAGRAVTTGAEASLHARPVGGLDLRLSATWLDAAFDDYVVDGVQLSGNAIPGVPPVHLSLGTAVALPRDGWVELEGEFTGRTWANDGNGPAPGAAGDTDDYRNDAWSTVALQAGWPVSLGWFRAELSAGIANLFDEGYNGSITPNAFGGRYFEPAAGRTWHAGVTIHPLRP
jgi:iron complex outermembrane receptor protein